MKVICYNYYYCLYWLVSWNPANVLEVFKPASMEKENAQVVFSLEHNLMVYEALKQEVSARVGVLELEWERKRERERETYPIQNQIRSCHNPTRTSTHASNQL